jgi:hypothetical protein
MITTRQDVEASPTVLPVTYPMLHNMVKQGDTIYIGRCVSYYLFVHLCCPICFSALCQLRSGDHSDCYPVPETPFTWAGTRHCFSSKKFLLL